VHILFIVYAIGLFVKMRVANALILNFKCLKKDW